ncbi:MAG: hypothetical protein ACRBN8_33615 [Nannocystales bacterium]
MLGWLFIAAVVPATPDDTTSQLDLRWDAPPSCPAAQEVRARVQTQLQGRPTPPSRLLADVAISTTPQGVQVTLRLESEGTRSARTFAGHTCAEAVTTAVLLMVMTLDPLAVPRARPEATPDPGQPGEPAPAQIPAPEPALEPEPVPEPGSEVDPKREPEPEPSPLPADPEPEVRGVEVRSIEARGRLGGGLGFGPLPSLGGMFELAAGIGHEHWAAHLTAEAWTPSTARTPRGSTASVWLAGFGLEGCGILTPARRWTVPLCAAIVTGPMSARGLEVTEADTARTAWVAARAAPGVVGWLRPWLGIGAHLSAHVAVYRPRFAIEPAGTVHAARSAGLRAWAFVSFRNRRTW